jgi:arsenite methyltransferase
VAAEPDHWSRWLLERRDADDERQRQVTLEHLAGVRDRILAHGEPLVGATLLDVGTGDGLIGLEALARVGPRGRVIFSDVSLALLEQVRDAVESQGAAERARFVAARAEDLTGIADASVDVVTTRSVLIYVAEKARAFSAMHRVLRPGGRLSLFEPINRLTFPEPADRFWGYDVSSVAALSDKVKTTFDRLEAAGAATMMDFDDRDLARLAESAGFERVHLECHIDIEPGSLMRAISLDALLDSSPNPLAPTVREAVVAALTEVERERFLAELGRAVAERNGIRRSAVAYLAAQKSA